MTHGSGSQFVATMTWIDRGDSPGPLVEAQRGEANVPLGRAWRERELRGWMTDEDEVEDPSSGRRASVRLGPA
jgi:hypothetical protein